MSDQYRGDDVLIAGVKARSRVVTIASGADLVRGAVLGIVTASGKYALSATAAGDGSETPKAVLAVDAAASGGDVEAAVYFDAEFNGDKLTYGTGHDASTVDAAFAAANAPMAVQTPV